MKTKVLSLILALTLLIGVLPQTLIPALVVETAASTSTNAESVLNSATLTPDHFLELGSNDYYPELWYRSGRRPSDYMPEDSDALIVSYLDKLTTSSMTTYEKVKAIYDYIINVATYEEGGHRNYYSVYSIFELGIGTCSDYNYTMVAFLRYLGFDAALVYGGVYSSSKESYDEHYWCEVYIDGETYLFDPEVDDKITERRNNAYISYDRFCKTYDELPDQYVKWTLSHTVYFASPDVETYLGYYYDCSSLFDYAYADGEVTYASVIADMEADEYAYSIEGASTTEWFYDKACTQPVDLDSIVRKNVMIWTRFSVDPFDDVYLTSYYADAVEWAVENGITTGTTDTTFSPTDICERCQVVTFLWRAAGSPTVKDVENPFTDVYENDYYYQAVLWAYANGITSGTTETTFGPTEKCERCQVVTFLWRAAGKPEPLTDTSVFTDVDPDAYYADAVQWAVEYGITAGTTETKFGSTDTCERCMIVTFLWRYQHYYVDPSENPNTYQYDWETINDGVEPTSVYDGWGAPDIQSQYFVIDSDHVIHEGKGSWNDNLNTTAAAVFDQSKYTYYDCDEYCYFQEDTTDADFGIVLYDDLGIGEDWILCDADGDGVRDTDEYGNEIYSTGYVGCWIESGVVIHQLRYYPRYSYSYYYTYTSYMVGGYFEASVDGETWTTLYTIEKETENGECVFVDVDDDTVYYYVRYVSPEGSYCYIAELEVWGVPAAE